MPNTITLDLDTGEWLMLLIDGEEPLSRQALMVGGEALKRTAVTPEQAVAVAVSLLPGITEEELLRAYTAALENEGKPREAFAVGSLVKMAHDAGADAMVGKVTRRVVDPTSGELHTVWAEWPGFAAIPYSPRQLAEVAK
jgi:hypothetical protein